MLQFNTYHADLNVKINQLKEFLDTVHFNYYKKNKDKNRFKRSSELKFTDDIFSAKYWVKSKNGLEQRVILDGIVMVDDVEVNTVTLEGEFFKKEIVEEFIGTFKLLSGKSEKGFLYNEVDSVPFKIEGGRIKDYDEMLREVFECNYGFEDGTKKKKADIAEV